MSSAYELRTSLNVAAQAAYLDGATKNQIDTIIALARGRNDFDIGFGGHLTTYDAGHIIDELLEEGAVADFNKSEAEFDAEEATAEVIEARIAYVDAAKSQKKIEKTLRVSQALEALRATADGRKVRHGKFGVGDVVGEDEATFTVTFAGQKKALKIGKTFLRVI